MKLINQELAKQIPALYSQEHNTNPMVYVIFSAPWSHWIWYVTEFDGKDFCFGFVQGDYDEWGYFSISELESITGPEGQKIVREAYFPPEPIKQILGDDFDEF